MNIQNKIMMINGWHSIYLTCGQLFIDPQCQQCWRPLPFGQFLVRIIPTLQISLQQCTVQITTPSNDDPVPTKQVVYKTFSTIKFSITILIPETAVGHHPMLFTSRWPAVECDILNRTVSQYQIPQAYSMAITASPVQLCIQHCLQPSIESRCAKKDIKLKPNQKSKQLSCACKTIVFIFNKNVHTAGWGLRACAAKETLNFCKMCGKKL